MLFHFLSRQWHHAFTTISPTTSLLLFFPNHPYHSVSLKFISITSKGHSFTVSYLIDTFGFSPQLAASLSKRLNFETREKPDSVIEFFKKHGFSQTQVSIVIRTIPSFLQAKPEKSLLPKIEFLKSKGFSNSDIPNIVTRCPLILKRSLHKEIIPSFDFFNGMLQFNDKLVKAVKRCSGILFDFHKISMPNIKLLREEGVPESHISRLLEYYPSTLKVSPKQFKEIVEEVKELGFNPLRFQFVVAVNAKKSISKTTWARKAGIYRKWGWTDNEIQVAFRGQPFCMTVSDNKIEAVMDFLVNKLGCESSVIARHPIVLSMSLEKRLIPRGSVILVLLSKGLVNKLNLPAMIGPGERVFLDKFIFCHEKEAGELLTLYKAKLDLARSLEKNIGLS